MSTNPKGLPAGEKLQKWLNGSETYLRHTDRNFWQQCFRTTADVGLHVHCRLAHTANQLGKLDD
jgi:hypothetical protein